MDSEYECQSMCKCECECQCGFERDRKCKCKCNGENKGSKERRVYVQGFSTAMSLMKMCACLSCHRDVGLFERSHVANNPDT